MRVPTWSAPYLAGLRMLLLATLVLGLAYPLVVAGIAHLPGLSGRTATLGHSFTDADGTALPRYFQSRPSAGGYDPTSTGASNLGPESVVDAPDSPSLLTTVCRRSAAIGALDGVSGARPYCATSGGVTFGAVLAVYRPGGPTGPVTRVVSVNQTSGTPFVAEYLGVPVTVARGGSAGEDLTGAAITPVRGSAPATPAVPADAVTASGSGLDPDISPAYAAIQVSRVARERGLPVATVQALVGEHTAGRFLGFLGAPRVNVVSLNQALDRASR